MPSRDGARRATLAGSPRDYAAAEQGFAGAPLPGFVRSELEDYVDCGLLQRGFALVARLAVRTRETRSGVPCKASEGFAVSKPFVS
jgi:hypothetical protein